MRHREFDWYAEASATKHGYTKEQIRSVFRGRRFLFKVGRRIYALLGRDDEGNLLEIIYRITGDGETRVFQCNRMRDKWRKRFERSKR